jgi:hypothetical protein
MNQHRSNSLSKITSLADKARARAWHARDVDWSLPVAVPTGVRTEVYVDMVSQLFWAERVALDALARMVVELPESEARTFLATQISDEDRHAQVYRGYLERLGDMRAVDPGLAEVFAAAAAWDGPAWAHVAALNVLMEHEALHQQHHRIANLPCPLFKLINTRIAADESRHAGFGVLYLEHVIPTASAADKAEVMAWLGRLWNLWRAANQGRYQAEGEHVLRLDAAELEQRGRRVAATLASLGFPSNSTGAAPADANSSAGGPESRHAA